MLWAIAGLVLLAVLAVFVVCLVQPVSIGVRAPDDGDLLSVRVRHPAVSLDLWVPLDTVIHWIAGIAEPPPIAGHVAGIPLPQRALAPVAELIAKQIAGRLKIAEGTVKRELHAAGHRLGRALAVANVSAGGLA